MENDSARLGPPGSATGPKMAYCKECGGQMRRIPGPRKPVDRITLVPNLEDLELREEASDLTCPDCGIKGRATRNQDDQTWEINWETT